VSKTLFQRIPQEQGKIKSWLIPLEAGLVFFIIKVKILTNFAGIIMDKSRIALITGGSGGIGSAIALSLNRKRV
jgi:hypothetical protein